MTRREDRGRRRRRAGKAVRARIRMLRRAVLRAYAPRIAAVVVLLVVVGVPVVWIQNTSFARGFFTALFVCVAVSVPIYVLAFNGVLTRGMGADAEVWTSDALRKLDPHRWFVLDDLLFDRANVDHVLVGPGGHVFAIESKWCSFGVKPEPFLDEWLRQARWGADRVAKLLRAGGVHRHVTPILIAWGPRLTIHGDHLTTIEDVRIATRKGVEALLDELRQLTESDDKPDRASREVLDRFRARQDEWLSTLGPSRRHSSGG